MGDAVAHSADLSHQMFDPIEHGIEICRELVPFIGSAMNRYSLLQVAFHDGSAGGVGISSILATVRRVTMTPDAALTMTMNKAANENA